MTRAPAPCTRAGILEEAARIVTRDRAATHGDAENNFAWIAGHWNWWLQDKLEPGASITPYDVAQMMVGFKQARAKGNPAFHDNAIDAVGYSALAGEIGAKQARSATERAAEGALGVYGATDTRQPVPGVYEQKNTGEGNDPDAQHFDAINRMLDRWGI